MEVEDNELADDALVFLIPQVGDFVEELAEGQKEQRTVEEALLEEVLEQVLDDGKGVLIYQYDGLLNHVEERLEEKLTLLIATLLEQVLKYSDVIHDEVLWVKSLDQLEQVFVNFIERLSFEGEVFIALCVGIVLRGEAQVLPKDQLLVLQLVDPPNEIQQVLGVESPKLND